MDILPLIIPAVVIVGVATLIFIGFYFSAKNKILRIMKKVRRKAIHSVRDNEYVKIVGKAKHAGEPLIAPLSKRKCMYYRVNVREKRGKHWKDVIDQTAYEDFFIQSGTESAIINLKQQLPNTQLIYIVTDHNKSSGTFNDANPELEAFLNAYGYKSTGMLGFNKTLRYTESIIEIDEDIAVMGIGRWKYLDKPVDGYSDSRILTLIGNQKQRLLITDEPKAMERVRRKL